MKTNNFFKWALALAIVIVLNLFFNFAIQLVYKMPIYENFCKIQQVNVSPDTQASCLAVGGQWNVDPNYYPKSQPAPTVALGAAPIPVRVVPAPVTSVGYCNAQFTCGNNFNDTMKIYDRNVFVALVILGLVSLFAGYYAGESAPVSLGLSLGGVLSFIIGSARYWSDMDDYLRVVILGLALVSLLWLGIKKFRE